METKGRILQLLMVVLSFQGIAQDKNQSNYTTSYEFEYKGDYDSAIKSLTSIYDKSSYFMNLRLGWLNYSNKNYDESIKYYQIACFLMPKSEEPLWALVNPLIAKENWAEVDRAYLSILVLDPKNSKANYQLGLNYYYRKNYTAAKKYLDCALDLFPYDYNTVLTSAWNHYFLGNKDLAKHLFNRILLIYPTDSSALEGIGLLK